ncbi:peroxidase homolog [Oratosquilla oratoria]|uniref:peroxidase homolog n=1 Tax=Oratosquilla oratoria TaxID=337810 RepID=UPI003F75ACEB
MFVYKRVSFTGVHRRLRLARVSVKTSGLLLLLHHLLLLVAPPLASADASPEPAPDAEADPAPAAFHVSSSGPGSFRFPGGRSFNSVPSSGSLRNSNSNCALLIPGNGKSSSFDHAIGVFNGIPSGPTREGYTCISFQSVDAAFKKARDRFGLSRPSSKMRTRTVASLGRVLIETTKIIASQYNLPRDAIINGLPLIDTSKTIIGTVCPDFIPPVRCNVERYRTFDGRCNNLENPTWGSAFTAFKRRLPPVYSDGIEAPRHGREGYELPSPRVVSGHLHRDEGFHDHAVTIMAVAWGQAIDHDFTLTGETRRESTNKEPECCTKDKSHPECLPIQVPERDPFYSLFKQRCLSAARSAPGIEYGCKLGPRKQINMISSIIDANWIYGSEDDSVRRLRLHRGGLLKSLPVFREFGMKDLLPLRLEDPDEGCIRPNNDIYCFDAGDARVNEQLVLAVVHTIMMREHNRIATELYEINPHWDDEKLYQEARHIIVAICQHITYNEFLPMILGKEVMNDYGLILKKHGYFNGYDKNVDPSMSSNFVTAAFRFGHSLLPSTIERWSPGHKYIASQRLSHMLRQPYDLYKGGWCDHYLMGLVNQVAQAMDDAISQEVTHHLFQEPERNFGMDLAALNMQRAREHGVPSYNEFRKLCGLTPIHDFAQLMTAMSNKTVQRYSDVYRHPDDMDLWSGGVSERPLPGSMVGPTFSCLIGLTFKEIRIGDRFWYENKGYPSEFTLEQLDEIRKVKLSRIICDNSDDIKSIQVYAMVLPDHEINPRVACGSGVLPRLDLSKWRDPHVSHPRVRPHF